MMLMVMVVWRLMLMVMLILLGVKKHIRLRNWPTAKIALVIMVMWRLLQTR